jgi:putative drug exporter of the RND superfamily
MHRLTQFAVARPQTTVACWLLMLAIAAPFALRLARVAQGGSEAIRGSESHAVMTTLDGVWGPGTAHAVPVVVTGSDLRSSDPRFAAIIAELTTHLAASPRVRGVTHPWNSGLPELLGRDGYSVLLLVQPDATTLITAENMTRPLRKLIAQHQLPHGWTTHVTGMSAMFHDLNRRSSADLLRAEALGVPLTLIVLFIVFRAVTAAALALAIAVSAVTLSSAFLCVLNPWLPASLLAQNVVTMIGLGAGTDYALFILSHYRQARARGASTDAAIVTAVRGGSAVLISGLAVAGGFAALFLVNVQFVHSLALGGVAVIIGSLAATFTLLPALLRLCGDRVVPKSSSNVMVGASGGVWARWASTVMRRPWTYLTIALAITMAWSWPALRAQPWRIGANDLPAEEESRRGQHVLERQFAPGWMGPVVITLEARLGDTLRKPAGQAVALTIAAELRRHPVVAHVLGFPRVLEVLGDGREPVPKLDVLPPQLATAAHAVISDNGRIGVVLAILREAPVSDAAVKLITALRSVARPAADIAGVTVKIGGGTAILHLHPKMRIEPDVTAATPLFATGLIDSMAILHLIAFVEDAIGRGILPEEVVMKHFASVGAIAETFWLERALS